jgi:DNA replication protein DnaC
VFAGDAIMASAALDRLLHRCTVVNIRGESFRMKEKLKTGAADLNPPTTQTHSNAD